MDLALTEHMTRDVRKSFLFHGGCPSHQFQPGKMQQLSGKNPNLAELNRWGLQWIRYRAASFVGNQGQWKANESWPMLGRLMLFSWMHLDAWGAVSIIWCHVTCLTFGYHMAVFGMFRKVFFFEGSPSAGTTKNMMSHSLTSKLTSST